MALGLPIFLHITVNIELGRENTMLFRRWVQNLRLIMERPSNVITANNLYDLEYTRTLTGVIPEYLPTVALYAKTTRFTAPSNRVILISKNHHAPSNFWADLSSNLQGIDFEFKKIHEYYQNYEYSDLQKHPGILMIPYTKSVMSFFEYYALGIPIFVPDAALLTRWEKEFRVMKERVYWQGTPLRDQEKLSVLFPNGRFSEKKEKTPIKEICDFPKGFKFPRDQWPVPPPNDISDVAAMEFWISKSDYYTWPHVQTFSSWDDLKAKLNAPDIENTLSRIRSDMRVYHESVVDFVKEKWAVYLDRMLEGIQLKKFHEFETMDDAWEYYYSSTFSSEINRCDAEPMFP
jgi:hypothetical protein